MKPIFIKQGDKKPTIVFLHGWGMSKEAWKNILPTLSKKHTVYAIDLLGFGDNQTNFSIFTLDDYLQQINDFLKEQNIENFILLGHSFGGMLAILYTIKYPEKVIKLILYSSSSPFKTKSISFVSYIRRFLGRNLILLFSIFSRGLKNRKVTLKDINQLYGIRNGIKPLYKMNILNTVKQPVLLLAGRFDLLSQLSYQKTLLEKFPNAKLVIFNLSTHAAHLEEKNKFINALENFTNESQSSNPLSV